MHECLTVQGWIKAWGETEAEGPQLAACPRCAPSRGELGTWLAAVQRCPQCRAALDGMPVAGEEALHCPRCLESLVELHETVEGLEHFDPVVAPEVLAADELLAKLTPLKLGEQLARVTYEPRYRLWGLCQRLLGACRELWSDDPGLALDRATVAAAVADLLDPEAYHPQWVADLRAKAHGYLANTHRILGDFREAEREFLAAENHLLRGVGSGRCQSEVFSLKASLLVDQSRFVEAGALLGEVEAYYREAEEPRELARTRLQRAMVAAGRGDFHGAAEECARAGADLDSRRDRRLVTLARQNAVHYFVQAGEVERARDLFDALPPAEGRMVELRRKWVEGDLLRAEGRYARAKDAYREARQGYADEGRFYDMGLIALEEALAAFDAGEIEEMSAMAEEASILLVKAAARHEALAVLRVLLTAMGRGTLDRATLLAVCRRVAALRPS